MKKKANIGYKLRMQMSQFMGGLHLPKVSLRFVREALYGIQSRQSTHLSEVSRSLNESISLKKTEERLCRQLARKNLSETLTDYVIEQSAHRISSKTLLILDPSDISKKYAKAMQYQAGVWDGSKGCTGTGYHLCSVVACEANSQEITPLVNNLWSQDAPDFQSENAHIIKALDQVSSKVKDRGIWVIDRGGDRSRLYEPMLKRNLQFLIRMVGSRHLIYRKKRILAKELIEKVRFSYRQNIVRQRKNGKEEVVEISVGAIPVSLPCKPDKQLYFVVVDGYGKKPMMILTTEKIKGKKKLQWVIEAYLTRWRIEDTLRFAKQSYQIEDIRILTYQRLQNMMSLVLLAMSFSMTRLSSSVKLEVLCQHALHAAKRFFGIPDFRYYAVADGIKEILFGLSTEPFSLDKKPQKHDNQMVMLEFEFP